MVDDRAQMDMMKEGNGYSMTVVSVTSRATDFEGYGSASTVNLDYPFRKREVHMKKAIENTTLKGRLTDSATMT